jgi:hypothetical protein
MQAGDAAMKHEQLMFAIGDAVVGDLKPLLGPLIASELARQRAGGDPHTPPALPALARSPDRFRLRTCVEWGATRRLNLLTDMTASIAGALADRVEMLVRNTLVAEKIADGTARREFDALVAEAKRIPAEQAVMRERIAHVKDFPRCQTEAQARMALQGLIASMRVKRERRGRAA